jgi:wyosine [tRNA(Phe)-imidazoG37] synthetase (radical SAM superfamily)
MENIVFGPVPSRRLGKSLGVNNIPPKICSYSCKYCQVGLTQTLDIRRQAHYSPKEIAGQVTKKLLSLSKADYPDYISIIPDGEPTLDANLGELIRRLGSFGLPVAVFTNSSLLAGREVRDELKYADFVSLKVDSVHEFTWKKINRPHKGIDLQATLEGIKEFRRIFRGICVTETMLIKYLNDSYSEQKAIAEFLQVISPLKSYIAIPTRPPAVERTKAADESSVMLAYEIFRNHNLDVELLTGYEGNAFASSGNFQEDILSITAVHPMRWEAVAELMKKSNASEKDLHDLLEEGILKKILFNQHDYYLRKFGRFQGIQA